MQPQNAPSDGARGVGAASLVLRFSAWAGGDGSSLPMRALGRLLGAIALKDLLLSDVPASLLHAPSDFVMPFIPGFPLFEPTPTTDWLSFAALVVGIVASFALLAGVHARLAAFVLLALYGVTFVADQLGYTNNVFLLMVLLALYAAEPLTAAKPSALYPQRLVQLLVTAMYATGALVKVQAHWLDGSILRAALFTYHNVYPRLLGWDLPRVFQFGAIASAALEMLLAIGLWNARARPWLMVAGLLFHMSIDVMMPVRMFSYLAPAAYIAFVPAPTLERVARWPVFASRLRLFVLGVAGAAAIDLFFAYGLGAVVLPKRNLYAAAIAAMAFALVVVMAMRFPASARTRVRLPRELRTVVVVACCFIELFSVTKPLYGFTNRFGWRMFTEELELRAECEVLQGDAWIATEIDPRWSSSDYRRYWDSLSEERNFLVGYTEWRARRDPAHRPFRVRMAYRLSGGPERVETVCSGEGRACGPSHASSTITSAPSGEDTR